MQQLEPVVDQVLRGNRQEDVRRMVRLCLTGMVMPILAAEEMSREEEACFKGYVYAEEVSGGSVVYKSPMLLVYALALRLGMLERVAAPAGCSRMGFWIHACWKDILPGAIRKPVDTRVLVSHPGDQVEQTVYHVYNHPTENEHAGAGVIFIN